MIEKEIIDVKVNIPESLKSNCIVGELGINIDNTEVCFTMKQMRKIKMEIEKLERQLKEANVLLLDFCSDDECRFDHNGYCQEHDSCEGGYKCIQKDLKQYLEKWGVK